MNIVTYVLIIAPIFVGAYADPSPNCLDCICEIEGCEQYENAPCNIHRTPVACGPFQLSEEYYNVCKKHQHVGAVLIGWKQCTKTKACSETCVKNYLAHYTPTCTGTSHPTCEQYGRVHHAGPNGCKQAKADAYAKKIKACCNRKGGRNGEC